jgi:hypothetical protein
MREALTTLGDLLAGALLVAGVAVHDEGAALVTAGLFVGLLSTHTAGLWSFPDERRRRK